MFLICSLSIGLIAVAIALFPELSTVEQAKLIPVAVRVKERNKVS